MAVTGEIRLAVIGAGSWGTTVAALTSCNAQTTLWARSAEVVEQINRHHRNPRYVTEHHLPDALRATAELSEAVRGADVVVMAVPSHGFREVVGQIRPWLGPSASLVSVAKGLESTSLCRMSEVIAQELPGHRIAVLTGPNLAHEVMAGQPAATVVASGDESTAADLQRIFSRPTMRVYTNPDVVGCEIAGVVKNVIAIAAGMAEGMGFGENTRATLITRGLAEMSRLGVAMGGDPHTFSGLAGVGDLIATCSSRKSRNNSVGLALGEGRGIERIVAGMNMVAEGVKSSPGVLGLAHRYGVEMPITEQVVAVCHQGRHASEALEMLMRRERRAERDRS